MHAGGGGSGTRRCAGPSWWPQDPVAVWLRVGARPCWLHGACQWLVSRHRHQGHGRGTVAAWSRGAVSCTMSGVVSPARRGGVRRDPAADRAAGSTVPQQGQARAGGPRAAGRSSTARGCYAPATLGPCAASGAMVHGPPGVAASCGPGGGSRSPGGPGPGVGLQPPNKGLQATGNSLRSCLAAALSRA